MALEVRRASCRSMHLGMNGRLRSPAPKGSRISAESHNAAAERGHNDILLREDSSVETAIQTAPAQPPQKRWMIWTGRVVSAVPVFFIGMGVATAILRPQLVAGGMAKFGYSAD